VKAFLFSLRGIDFQMPCLRFFVSIFILLAALLSSGCSVALNLKTVETAPKGQSRSTFGAGLWLTDASAYYSDSGSLAESSGIQWEGAVSYSFRYGITENLELGFSADPPWPGVGGKFRFAKWAALDANVKMLFPIWKESPSYGAFYDASLVIGGSRTYGGVKCLSDGMVPMSEGRGRPDAILFMGRRYSHWIPEALFSLRHREGAIALGLIF
jgi:hypothetical protein